MQQLFSFGARSGVEAVEPFAPGDILVTKSSGRVVIERVERDTDAIEPEVLICIRLDNGSSVIKFPREIAYRSK